MHKYCIYNKFIGNKFKKKKQKNLAINRLTWDFNPANNLWNSPWRVVWLNLLKWISHDFYTWKQGGLYVKLKHLLKKKINWFYVSVKEGYLLVYHAHVRNIVFISQSHLSLIEHFCWSMKHKFEIFLDLVINLDKLFY